MKITGVDTVIVGNAWKNWIIVRLETDSGIEGIGEGTLEHRILATETGIRELADYIIGRDPTDVEKLLLQLKLETYTPGILVHTIASAFEVACWDILGKNYNVPVYRLLGGRVHDQVPVYANGWYRVDRSAAKFQEAAEVALKHGFRALKFDPFGAAYGTLSERETRLSLEIIKGVKEICDKYSASIIIEGHARFDAATAKRVARYIEPFDPLWFEEPVYYYDIHGTAAVRQSTCVPISGGERGITLSDYVQFLRDDSLDILQPDIAHVGGLLQAKKIAALAEGFGKYCTFHSPLSPITTAASLQLGATCVNFHMQECFDHFNPDWTEEVFGPPPSISDGMVEISQRPGLGIVVDWEKAKQHPYAKQHRQFMFRTGWEKRQGRQDTHI